jgi:hypothetical protein
MRKEVPGQEGFGRPKPLSDIPIYSLKELYFVRVYDPFLATDGDQQISLKKQ